MPREQKTDSMIILALECSGNAASAAIMIDGKIAGFQEHKARHGHAETLIMLTDQAAKLAGVCLTDITHIAAGCGPGSFTGLRVCLATAKGYHLATGANPIGVNGLTALAYHAMGLEKTSDSRCYLSLADSRRGTFFAQIFDAKLRALSSIEDVDIPALSRLCEQQYTEMKPERLVICGLTEADIEGHKELADMLSYFRADNRTDNRLSICSHHLDAADIAGYAQAAIAEPASYPITGLDPLYLSAPKLGNARVPADSK